MGSLVCLSHWTAQHALYNKFSSMQARVTNLGHKISTQHIKYTFAYRDLNSRSSEHFFNVFFKSFSMCEHIVACSDNNYNFLICKFAREKIVLSSCILCKMT